MAQGQVRCVRLGGIIGARYYLWRSACLPINVARYVRLVGYGDVCDRWVVRWQAAKNMKGEPIPGPHWIEVDLGGDECIVSRVLVDWETAHAKVRLILLLSTRFF